MSNTKKASDISIFDFYDANYELMGLDNSYLSSGNLNHIVKQNDLVQNLELKRTKKDMVLWCGIENPSTYEGERFSYVKNLFNKCINLKKGDIFHMPEYSFWSNNKSVALIYAKPKSTVEEQGLVYELRVPKGSEVYENSHHIFRRYSKFLCTDNQKVVDGNKIYNHIKLELLPRDINKKDLFK